MGSLKILPLTLLILLVTGCATHEGAVTAGKRGDNFVQLNQVLILSDSLERVGLMNTRGKIAVEQNTANRTATGTLEVAALLRNRTDHNLQLEARTRFFDESKIPSGRESQWKRLFLEANSLAGYREYSLYPEAAYYQIEIREAP